MKFIKLFAIALTAAVVASMTGCQKDKPEKPDPAGRVAVNLEVGILETGHAPSLLKVANGQWEASDRVGLYMKKAGLNTVYGGVANVQMSIQGGRLQFPQPVFYPQEGKVDFVAYYPYTAAVGGDLTIPVNVANQASGLPVELLYSNNATDQAPTESPVKLDFRYSLAKLSVTVTAPPEAFLYEADFAAMNVSIEGVYTQARLQLLDGTFTAHQNKAPVTLRKTGHTLESASFEALILPTTEQVTFVFTAGDDIFKYVFAGNFSGGNQYNLKFSLNREVELLNDPDFITCRQVDPLQKIFDRNIAYSESTDPAAVAKGETATFQFVLKSGFPITNLKITATPLTSGGQQIPASLKAFVRYVTLVNQMVMSPVYPEYPDCLWDGESMNVPAGKNQPVWVEYQIPKNAVSGDYKANLVFTGTANGKHFQITKEVTAKVYPVVLPEQTLFVHIWYGTGFRNSAGQLYPLFSEDWWRGYEELIKQMGDYGNNVYMIDQEGEWNLNMFYNIQKSGSQYLFDFTNFDRAVEIARRVGRLKLIAGKHVGGHIRSQQVYGFNMPDWSDPRPFDDQEAQDFWVQFLTAKYNHVVAKGWKDIYVQYVADEPSINETQYLPSWRRFAGFVKQHMPGIRTADAVQTPDLGKDLDIYTPALDYYFNQKSYYDLLKAQGHELWMYTACCTNPNWANRYIEQPLTWTRYLHWFNYRNGLTGYMHWAYNRAFFSNLDRYDDVALAALEAGDAWIVYRHSDKTYTSIRLAAQRDGIADYELLKLLSQKNSSLANTLANRIITGNTNYANIVTFRTVRRELLEALSQ